MTNYNVGWVRINKDRFINIFPYFKGQLWEIDDEGPHERNAWFLIESDIFPQLDHPFQYPIPKYELIVTVDKVDNKIIEAEKIDE